MPENIIRAKCSGKYIFKISLTALPPSRLFTGNKFITAYIILVKNAKNKIETYPFTFIIKKINNAAIIFINGPLKAIIISVLYDVS